MDGHFVPNITIGPAGRGGDRASAAAADRRPPDDRATRPLRRGLRRGRRRRSPSTSRPWRTCTARSPPSRSAASRPASRSTPRPRSARSTRSPADVDYVLVMTVNPGFGGQTFIPRRESKVRDVRELLDRAGSRAPSKSTAASTSGRRPRTSRPGRDIVAGAGDLSAPDSGRATRELRTPALRRRAVHRHSRGRRTARELPRSSRVRVRYAETDKMGVVYLRELSSSGSRSAAPTCCAAGLDATARWRLDGVSGCR